MQKLNDIPGKNPFKVPENYFEDVNRKIISAASGHVPSIKKAGLYKRVRPYFLIAAAVTGFVLMSYTAVKLLTAGKMTSQQSEVMSEENAGSYINDIDILTLEENAAPLDLSEEVPEVNKTDIIDYLMINNIEISDIYEQL